MTGKDTPDGNHTSIDEGYKRTRPQMTVAQMDQEAPAPGEYSALLAILNRIGQSRPPIPLWRLGEAGLTAAQLKAALHSLAVRGCIRATYKAGLPDEVVEVYPEAGRLAAAWALRRS